MGYKPKRRIYRLEFTEPDMGDLEVRVRSLSTGELMRLWALYEQAERAEGDLKCEEVEELLTIFAKRLASWNIEDDDGSPAPANLDGVKSQELEFNLRVIGAWIDAITTAPAPLEPSSPGGEPSPEESLPMEPLSASQAS